MRLIVLVWFGIAATARGGDTWPEFRGPTADGHAEATGLPLTWSETENIAWSTAIHGYGWSSPVVWGDRVWMTTGTDDGKELFAICVDLATGRIMVDNKVFDVPRPSDTASFNSFASPTPVLEEGRAYLSWGSPGIASLDSRTAEVLWTRRDLECDHYRGAGSSPILFENLLIMHFDGFDVQYVVALDKRTGETVWRTPRRDIFGTDNGDLKKAYATPIVIDVNGRQQLISPAAKATFAYDPRTGEELWYVRYEQHSAAARPLFANGLLYLSTGFSRGEVMAVRPDGQGDVTDTHIVWREMEAMPNKPSPLLIGDLLYTISDKGGAATCLDAMTGEQVWQERVGGNYSASPIFADGRIYFFSDDGKTAVIAPGREFKLMAENTLGDGCMASPAVVGNSLILRSRSHLYRVEQLAAGN